MSAEAPWIALAVDWDESQMWEALPQFGIEGEATDGERLAWIFLLCEAKKKGRGGKVSIRKSAFQRVYRISARAVDGMLRRAQKCGAATIDGDTITLCGWRTYQQKTGGKKCGDFPDSPNIPESAPTDHRSQITDHQPPPPQTPPPGPPAGGWEGVVEVLSGEGLAIAERAADECRQRGNTPAEAMFVIEQWRRLSPRPQVGLLGAKLRSMREGSRVVWPEEYARRAQQEQLSAKQLNDREEHTRDREKNQAERVRLEQEFGQQLDALELKQVRAIVSEKFPALLTLMPRQRPVSGLLRESLLSHLESVAKRPDSVCEVARC